MDAIARRVAQEAKRVTRKEVIVRAIAKELTWIQAADVCGITARQMRRLKSRRAETLDSGTAPFRSDPLDLCAG